MMFFKQRRIKFSLDRESGERTIEITGYSSGDIIRLLDRFGFNLAQSIAPPPKKP